MVVTQSSCLLQPRCDPGETDERRRTPCAAMASRVGVFTADPVIPRSPYLRGPRRAAPCTVTDTVACHERTKKDALYATFVLTVPVDELAAVVVRSLR